MKYTKKNIKIIERLDDIRLLKNLIQLNNSSTSINMLEFKRLSILYNKLTTYEKFLIYCLDMEL